MPCKRPDIDHPSRRTAGRGGELDECVTGQRTNSFQNGGRSTVRLAATLRIYLGWLACLPCSRYLCIHGTVRVTAIPVRQLLSNAIILLSPPLPSGLLMWKARGILGIDANRTSVRVHLTIDCVYSLRTRLLLWRASCAAHATPSSLFRPFFRVQALGHFRVKARKEERV